MNAIIIAAGSGKRISEDVKSTPKSMICVNEKPIINFQIEVLKKSGINEIFVITGKYHEKFNVNNVEYIHDKEHEKHDILGSLMEARKFLKGDVVILYSDIIFEAKIIQQILKSNDDISIAIDMDWKKHYKNRNEHPESEAENVLLDSKGNIIEIRKNIKDKKMEIGEFLGIMKVSNYGSKIFVKKYEEILKKHEGNFHSASSISKAYLTDMLQELIDSNINIEPVFVEGKWCEIDTMQDLKIAEELFNN